MIIRADHVAGAIFVLSGILVFALSGDLPFGTLSFPDAGFLPKIIATLLIGMGVLLAFGARDTAPFRALGWGDLGHAAAVLVITGVAIYLYTWLGFVFTLPLLLFALLVLVERKGVLPSAVYSLTVTLLAYSLFRYVLNAPIPLGPFYF